MDNRQRTKHRATVADKGGVITTCLCYTILFLKVDALIANQKASILGQQLLFYDSHVLAKIRVRRGISPNVSLQHFDLLWRCQDLLSIDSTQCINGINSS